MKTYDDLPYIDNPEIFSAELRRLYGIRISTKYAIEKIRRKNLEAKDKVEILQKTDNRCHICGQELNECNFQADHISPHSTGGKSGIENYIAACNLCNNYRWNYLPEEIKWIMKVGVWAKTQIEFETEIGKTISNAFIEYERSREQRRKNKRQPLTLETEKYPIREKIDYAAIQQKNRHMAYKRSK